MLLCLRTASYITELIIVIVGNLCDILWITYVDSVLWMIQCTMVSITFQTIVNILCMGPVTYSYDLRKTHLLLR